MAYTEHDANYEKAYTERIKAVRDADIKEKEIKYKSGLIGSIIGTGNNAKINVAYSILVFFSIVLIGTLFFEEANLTQYQKNIIENIWNTFPPFITLVLGYIFGKNSADKE